MEMWRRVLEGQQQVIARQQAMSGGMTRHAWAWQLERGTWTELLPGVAVAHSGGVTDEQRAWAAVLHAGKGARLSGDAGLLRLGFRSSTRESRPPFDVAIPQERRVRMPTLPGGSPVLCHRMTGLDRWAWQLSDLPLVSPHAAVLHACAWAPTDRAAEWRLAAVVQQGLTAVPLIRLAFAQMPRLHRRVLIAAVLDDVELGAHAASELQFLRFCRTYQLPLPDALQVRVRAGKIRYLDAHYRQQRIIIEVDGAHHRFAAQWEADVLRSLQLAVAHRGSGEQIIRLTKAAMRHDGPEVAALLRSLLCGC